MSLDPTRARLETSWYAAAAAGGGGGSLDSIFILHAF